MKRVAVLGAGASGLASAKCLLEKGLSVTVFEQEDDVGGLWRFTEDERHSAVYRSTQINTSKELMCYSDFPIPADLPTFLHNTEVYRYLRSYGEHFGVLKHIRFGTTIERVERRDDGQYRIHLKDSAEPELFDAVVVATGHHHHPSVPDFKGAAAFKGATFHSHAYKDLKRPVDLDNKRVLVVGVGNSGVDIAVEASRAADQVFLSTRSGAWVLSRFVLGGVPLDHVNTRFTNALPAWLQEQLGRFVHKLQNGDMANFGLEPGHNLFGAHPTINGELLGRIGTGSIKAKANIAEIRESSVLFEDGTTEDIDVIVFCTGYRITFPFLADELSPLVGTNRVDLFKYIWPPAGPGTIAFQGLFQPLGAIMPISELQARWIADVFAGDRALPTEAAMRADVDLKRRLQERRYRKSPRHTIQVDYLPYANELAEFTECRPQIPRLLLQDPGLVPLVLFGPASPHHYRLHGPGAWDGAAAAIREANRDVYAPFRTRPGRPRTQPRSALGGASGILALAFAAALVMLWRRR